MSRVFQHEEQVKIYENAELEEQKKYLEGLIEKMDMGLDQKINGHTVDIHFNHGFADDAIVYKNLERKN